MDVNGRIGKATAPRNSRPGGSPAPPERSRQPEPGFRARAFAWIRRIPRGRVATYGQISRLAGHPRRARMVGQALANLSAGEKLPWHRVVNAQGMISPRGTRRRSGRDSPEARQRRLLEREGVAFTKGRIDLRRYRWEPESSGRWR